MFSPGTHFSFWLFYCTFYIYEFSTNLLQLSAKTIPFLADLQGCHFEWVKMRKWASKMWQTCGMDIIKYGKKAAIKYVSEVKIDVRFVFSYPEKPSHNLFLFIIDLFWGVGNTEIVPQKRKTNSRKFFANITELNK